MSSLRRFTFALASLFLASTAGRASAQAELTGTYVRYFDVGADGRFMNGSSTFQYTESGSMPYSCDFFYPGSPYEGFYLAATAGGTPSERSNSELGNSITTLAGPTLAGRTITWRGRYTHASAASATIDIDQVVTYAMADRAVRIDVTLRNSGTMALTNVTYGRRGEPDQGSCSIGSDYTTTNDVLRQPPTASSALMTAAGGMTSIVVLGIGAFDTRARMDVGGWPTGGISEVWTSPRDPGGTPEDTWIQFALREPTLAVGASTTFTFYYVFGTTTAQIEMRFDELNFPTAPCVGLAEGAACTTMAGLGGLCRGGVCCTGCWNGTRCQAGTVAGACALGGAMCRNCDDSMFCTLDQCTAAGTCASAASPAICDDGVSCTSDICSEATDSCSHPPAAGCTIGGECIGDGEINPSYPCLHCDPTVDDLDWSPIAAGSSCGADSCSAGNVRSRSCDGAGACVLGAAMPCPTGACAGPTSCVPPCAAGACPAGEYCDSVTMVCTPLGTMGEPCTDGAGCDTGWCVDGACCESACDGACEECAASGTEGACSPVAAGSDPADECPLSECDGAGACAPPPDGGGPLDAGSRDGGAPLTDAGMPPRDAAPGVDGGPSRPRDSSGCNCGVVPSRAPRMPFAIALLCAVAVAWRRRRP